MEILGQIEKNSMEVIKAQIGEFKGYPVIDFRVWVEKEDGRILPTRKGLSFNPELLEGFYNLVKSVYERLKNE